MRKKIERLDPLLIPESVMEELRQAARDAKMTLDEYIEDKYRRFPLWMSRWVHQINNPVVETQKQIRERRKAERKEAKRLAEVEEEDRRLEQETREALAQGEGD